MRFQIKCETFARLAKVPKYFSPERNPDYVERIQYVMVEIKDGDVFAIATNITVAVIEYLGRTNEADGVAYIKTDTALTEVCEKEKMFDSFVDITTIPQIAASAAKTMLGFQIADVCGWPTKSELLTWRTWAPDIMPTQDKGPLYWDSLEVETLFEASPSGRIAFPDVINIDAPIVLRDVKSENWLGLFMGRPSPSEDKVKAAELPKWWK